jgi:hypothetical protein
MFIGNVPGVMAVMINLRRRTIAVLLVGARRIRFILNINAQARQMKFMCVRELILVHVFAIPIRIFHNIHRLYFVYFFTVVIYLYNLSNEYACLAEISCYFLSYLLTVFCSVVFLCNYRLRCVMSAENTLPFSKQWCLTLIHFCQSCCYRF